MFSVEFVGGWTGGLVDWWVGWLVGRLGGWLGGFQNNKKMLSFAKNEIFTVRWLISFRFCFGDHLS